MTGIGDTVLALHSYISDSSHALLYSCKLKCHSVAQCAHLSRKIGRACKAEIVQRLARALKTRVLALPKACSCKELLYQLAVTKGNLLSRRFLGIQDVHLHGSSICQQEGDQQEMCIRNHWLNSCGILLLPFSATSPQDLRSAKAILSSEVRHLTSSQLIGRLSDGHAGSTR